MNRLEYVEYNLMSVNKLPGNPFLKKGWRGHLFVTANYLTEQDFFALQASVGKDVLGLMKVVYHGVCAAFDSIDDSSIFYQEIPFEWAVFDEKVNGFLYGNTGVYVFGDSETWGILCPDDDYYCVGGDDVFMRNFEGFYGGGGRIISDFRRWSNKYGSKFIDELIESFYHDSLGDV